MAAKKEALKSSAKKVVDEAFSPANAGQPEV